jgi:hypothetical protein
MQETDFTSRSATAMSLYSRALRDRALHAPSDNETYHTPSRQKSTARHFAPSEVGFWPRFAPRDHGRICASQS